MSDNLEMMNQPDDAAPEVAADAAPAVSSEPSIDLSTFRLEAGQVADLLAHIKAWVEWRMSGSR